MSKLTPQPDGVARPKAPYSPVVVDGGFVYTAGQVGFDENGDLVPGGIEAQTRRALENVTACLRAAGCERTDVLKVNAYLADLADFEGVQRRLPRVLRGAVPGADDRGRVAPRGAARRDRGDGARPGVTDLDVETPTPVVDLDRLEHNLSRWQERCDELGLRNRPHVKTHKCTEIARRQVALGAAGLTCQTLGEAEAMADAGMDDLLVADVRDRRTEARASHTPARASDRDRRVRRRRCSCRPRPRRRERRP